VIVFCHGLESVPHGRKYHAMVDAGLDVVAPDCQKKNLVERVEILTAAIEEHAPVLVVGSSFGGMAGLLACLQASHQPRHLLLLAPALQLPTPVGVTLRCPVPTTIIHGTRDEIIPIDLSRRFAAAHGATLVEVDDSHALPDSLDLIVEHARRIESAT
jgi:pimeloyl-ACP methyl ester carboxylesterase